MSKFKIGLTIVFGLFIVLGIIVFATSKGSSSGPQVPVTVWGFVPQNTFNDFLQQTTLAKDKTVSVNYVEKNPATFQNDFVNALANGNGPDVIMISQEQLYQNENKILTIPYATYSERAFKDAFVQEGEIFLSGTGVMAVPFTIDPMVMYWNRDIFNAASISQPPTYWDQVLTLPTRLTKIDKSGNIQQSTVALGEWGNVDNAKAILANLLLQSGSVIVDTTTSPPRAALLDNGPNQTVSPAAASINFYTQFANPTSQTYSWNRSEPDSLTDFLSGNLALYFGFASELTNIRSKNPNLNFDVAALPQPRQKNTSLVFGRIYGLAIVKQSKNPNSAFTVISQLTDTDSLSKLTTFTNLPPVSRPLLATPPADPYQNIFYSSALISVGWLDPNPQSTNAAFGNMIESITSGTADSESAVLHMNDQLNALF